MDFIKSIDWPFIGFLTASATMDYYLYKHLTWRVAIDLPSKKNTPPI